MFVLQEGSIGQVNDPSLRGVELDIAQKHAGDGKPFMSLRLSLGRIRAFGVLLFVLIAVFFARSAQLQIVQGDHYSALSERNREYAELIVPERGSIYDRWGTPLAKNESTFTLVMRIADLPEEDDEREVAIERVADLAGIVRTDIDLLISDYATRSYDYVPIKEHVAYEPAMRMAIEIAQIDGFDLITGTRRVYNSSVPSLSHILGYIGSISPEELDVLDNSYRPIDTIGKLGVEKTAEGLLRGTPGALVYEVNASGERTSIVSKTETVPGADISLSIDLEFQKKIETLMQETFGQVNASKGSVIAIDPQTGAIRALVSLPAYDSNLFIGGIDVNTYQQLLEDEDQPLFPRAIAGEYPSGSTFKPFVVYAALAESLVGEHTSFLSTGGIGISQWYFPDWKDGGHGVTDARKAIAESVNTYFYIIGGGYDNVTGLGVAKINAYASRFGFGAQTGIDIPGENDGFLPTKEWKQEAKGERWYVGDTYHLSIGQGDFLTTPLQMAVATSVIANGGFLFKPYVIETVDGYGPVDLAQDGLTSIEDLDTYAMLVVRQGMRQTITQGSARSLSTLSEAVAGKTGTAQTPGDRPYHSWFSGFGPYEDPNLALVVLVEEGGGSNDAAVPLARSIFDWWFTNR